MLFGRIIPRVSRTVSNILPSSKNFIISSTTLTVRRFHSTKCSSIFSNGHLLNNCNKITASSFQHGRCFYSNVSSNSSIFNNSTRTWRSVFCSSTTTANLRFRFYSNISEKPDEAKEEPAVPLTREEEETRRKAAEKLKRNTKIALYSMGFMVVGGLVFSIAMYGQERKDPDGNIVSSFYFTFIH
jgi:hypothetical protein